MTRERPATIGHWRDHLSQDDATYPGSKELLSQGAPIGRILGLKAMGIHVEILAPGRRTSWPHAESAEEEFVFVLKGTPHVWIDGEVHPLVEGDFVAFPAGTGIAHTFLNDTDDEVHLLVGGQTAVPDAKIFYPLHPARNAQCAERGFLWEDVPHRPLGSHDGMTAILRRDPPDDP